jgi:hypothetical protein
MKKFSTYLFIFLGLSSCTVSCNFFDSNPPKYSSVYVFVDVTGDEDMSKILDEKQLKQIESSMGWSEGGNIFNGGEIRMFTLSDLNMTESLDMKIPMGNNSGYEAQTSATRDEIVEEFKNSKLRPSIKSYLKSLSKGKNESEIYLNLCKQLNKISTQPADKKSVIIFSDMLENSKLFSFYGINPVDISDFKKAEASCAFPKLSDVDVYIVPPVSIGNKGKVQNAERVWSSFFTSKNVKSLHFDVNLNIE